MSVYNIIISFWLNNLVVKTHFLRRLRITMYYSCQLSYVYDDIIQSFYMHMYFLTKHAYLLIDVTTHY